MSTATDELISAYLAELAREAARLPWNARTELLEDVRSHIEVALAELREAGSTNASDEASSDASSGSPGSENEQSQVRAMLAALGEPSEIVAAALADDPALAAAAGPAYAPEPSAPTSASVPGYGYASPPTAPPYPLGSLDVVAVTLLLLGGFLAGIGWLVGAVLLWTSPRWTRLEKLIGTLVLPGGIAGGLLAYATAHSGSHAECAAGSPCVVVHTGWNPPGWLAALTIAVAVIAPAVTTVYLVNRARLRPGPAASRVVLAVMAGVGSLGVFAAVGLLGVTSSSSSHAGTSTPVPSVSSWSGYVAPVSSPPQPSSSASAP